MSRLLFSVYLALIASNTWAAIVSSTDSKSLSSSKNTSFSETTSIPTTTLSNNVDTTGVAQCPSGQVMVGFTVGDSTNAYVSYNATKDIDTDCKGFHFYYTNYQDTLMQDPTQLTFTIFCRSIDMDFF